MARERLVVGVDVGTTKICTLIARVTEDEQLEILGAGVTRSDALRKGSVVSVEQAANDIQSSIQKAEQQSGFKIISAYVTISGSHLQTEDAHGMVTIRRSDRAITEDDVNRALDAARMANLPPDREMIDLVPRHFTVDGQEEIASPVGMLGQRLEVTGTMITGAKSAIQNLTHCVERAGISIDALVPQALAAGEAVLTPAERDLGVTLIDLGGGTTDVGIFAEGGLIYATVLPVGGQQISNDIAVRLRTPYSAAEEIKIRHGQAFANGREEDRLIDVSSFDSDESTPVSVRMVCDTIEDRLVDTFELIRKRLARVGFDSSLPAGTVLVGGTAQLHGIRRLAAEILESPVRVASPSGILGLGEQLSSPGFAASVGLLRWGLRHGDEASSPFGASAISGAFTSIINWLRSFLP
jgi:cell division protein FtsA